MAIATEEDQEELDGALYHSIKQVSMLLSLIMQDTHDLAPEKGEIVNQLRPLLPASYANGCGAL